MKKVIKFYKNHEEIINYVIVGGLTTLVSLLTYFICVHTILDANNPVQLQISNIISWIFSVAFAYVTNRIYVFKSKNKDIFKEISLFYVSRITTLLIDMLFMFVLVTLLSVNDTVAKILVQFIIVVLNYIFSKILVFKRKNMSK